MQKYKNFCAANRDGGVLEGNEMKRIAKYFKQESGQALVIVAVSLVALLGITAFSVDLGGAYNAKAKLQAAADAAALAGAQDLPATATAESTAMDYAQKNGADISNNGTVVTFPDLGKHLIEVVCTKQYDFLFARVLGIDSKQIVVRAVATSEAPWVHDALPFMNLDDNYLADPNMTLWEKTTHAGDDEKLWPLDTNKVDAEYEITQTNGFYSCKLVDMEDGFALKSGITSSDQKEIEGVVQQYVGQYVYVLSLDATKAGLIDPNLNYDNKQNISTHDVVLLKCKLVSYNFSTGVSDADFGIHLEYTGESYPFDKVLDGTADVPDINSGGKPIIKLVQ